MTVSPGCSIGCIPVFSHVITGYAVGAHIARSLMLRCLNAFAAPHIPIVGGVGADALIGPNPPEAGLFGGGAQTTQPGGRLIAAPTNGAENSCAKTAVCNYYPMFRGSPCGL